MNALRYHSDQGTLDPRDFASKAAMAFDTLSRTWVTTWVQDRENVTRATARQYEVYVARATEFFGDKNVRSFKTRDIQRFLDTQTHMKPKSKNILNACLKSLFKWMLREDHIRQQDLPVFPVVKFKLGTRKTVSKETQTQIISELRDQTFEKNPKVHLGISWLATYVCLRPGDLFRIRERDIDRRNRMIYVRDPKCTEPYELPLTKGDVETLLRFLPGEPEAPFFRHPDGRPFGVSYFYVCWKRACAAVEIEGVDLYGGTRHSSVRAMRREYTPEQIKWATMHRTSAAFERYFTLDAEDLRTMYDGNQQSYQSRTKVSGGE